MGQMLYHLRKCHSAQEPLISVSINGNLLPHPHPGTESGENVLIGFKVGHQASALTLFPQRQMGGLKKQKLELVIFILFLD